MNYLFVSVSIVAILLSGYAAYNHDSYGGRDVFGAITYPTTLDTFTNPSATDKTNSPSHATQHSNANDAIEALQAKVGADGSAVTTSHDYKLSGVTGSDKACSLTGTETLTNKTLTSPLVTGLQSTTTSLFGVTTLSGTTTLSSVFNVTGSTTIDVNGTQFALNLGSDATGDVYYRNASGYFTRLGAGSDGQVLKLASGIPSWAADSISGGIKFRGVGTTSQSLAASPAKLYFTDDFDTGSDHSNGTFTTPEDGYYLISSRLNTNGARDINSFIYVNGAASSTMFTNSIDGQDPYISDTLFLSTGDTVEIWADYDGGATAVTVEAGTSTTYFSVVQL